MLGKFIHILNQSKADLDDLQIAEALWLSRFDTIDKESVATDEIDRPDSLDAEITLPDAHSIPSSQPLQPERTGDVQSKSLFAGDSAAVEGGRSVPVSQIRAPGVASLPAALLISRALRPFSRRVDSNIFERLDERATVELSAELSRKDRPLIQPVMKPAKERWFEIALVVEETPSMAVWRSTINELALLLGRHGAFRDVRLWRLRFDGNSPRLVSTAQVEVNPQTLDHTSSRRLVLLISDGVSSRWRDGSIARQIARWSESMPVVIGQMLSERLWRRTALGEPTAEIKAPRPGAVNKDLKLVKIKWWDRLSNQTEDDEVDQRDDVDPSTGKGNRIVCPVVSLDPNLISQWAAMATGSGKRYKAVLLSPDPQQVPDKPQKNPAGAPSAEARIERYRKIVSPEADDLAVFLSMMPLALPVMRVVQRAMIQNPRQEQLAEFLLGGLLKRKDPNAEQGDHDRIQYEFHDGVRELLRSDLRLQEVPPVIACVSEFIGRRIKSIHDFLAWAQDAEGTEQAEGALPFAEIGLAGLEHLGYSRRVVIPPKDITITPSGISVSAVAGTATLTVESQIETLLGAETSKAQDIVTNLLKLAEAFAAAGKVEDSLLVYQKIIERFPEMPEGWNALAKFYLKPVGAVPGASLLRAGLQHENEVARIYAVQALASLGTIITVDEVSALIETMSADESEVVRSVAAKVLAQFPGDKVEAALWERIKDDLSEAVRAAAAKSYETVTRDRPNNYFFFDTVTLDESGNEIQRRRLAAHQFVEDLGDGVTLEMVEIPGGKFTMGSPESESGRWEGEGPQHEVELSPFFIGKYTVTQAQWCVVAGWEKIEIDLNPDPSHFKGDDRPVESISWLDAQEFCARLAKQTGQAYRLPTEAEWEYACRANTSTPFAFGETVTSVLVNYDGNYPYGKAPKGEYRIETVKVGSLKIANAFGLYDMHGNVWEWCEDWFSGNYYEECRKQGVVKDPQGPEKRGSRVLRGGSYYDYSRNCRSAARNYDGPGVRVNDFGFRVVVSARTK